MSRRFICASLLHARMHAISERRRTPMFIAFPCDVGCHTGEETKRRKDRVESERANVQTALCRLWQTAKRRKIGTQAELANNIATIAARIAARIAVSVAISADCSIIRGCHFRATQWAATPTYPGTRRPGLTMSGHRASCVLMTGARARRRRPSRSCAVGPQSVGPRREDPAPFVAARSFRTRPCFRRVQNSLRRRERRPR
jgi:hypothetical protein